MLKTAVPAVSTKPLEGGFEEFLSIIFFANLTFGLFKNSTAIFHSKFSPMCRGSSRWLASSGNDGVICFWSWDSKTLAFK